MAAKAGRRARSVIRTGSMHGASGSPRSSAHAAAGAMRSRAVQPGKVRTDMLSLSVATAVGLGAIIGAGIFALSGTAIALAGSEALIAFILVGIVVLLVALQLGELGSILPKSKGASYSFVYYAFGSELGFITGLLLYMCYATAISVVSLSFGAYLSSMLGLSTVFYERIFAIVLIFILALVNLRGIKKAANTDSLLVFIKIGILAIFIAFALLYAFTSGGFSPSNFASGPDRSGITPIFEASVAIFFAYSGFQAISTFTSRISGGPNAAAKAILSSVIISIVLYVLVVLGLLFLMPASRYQISADPLAGALQYVHAPSWLSYLVDIGALVATTSAALAMMLSASRILYQVSEDHLLPKILRVYNKNKDVATNGIILSAFVAVATLFAGNVYIIAAISNFGLIFSYIMASFALLHFRRIRKLGTFKVPWMPYIAIITIIALLAFMYGMPNASLVVGVIMIMVMIIVYYFLREFERKRVIRVRLFR